jgi:beta-lactamase class A
MIQISHNYAALLLTEQEGLSNVQKFLSDYTFNESSVGQPPKTTAADIAAFFEKAYKGELVDPVYSAKMIELLKGQKLNGKLPKYLPDSIDIAHKTGELDSFSHDAGIVFSPNADYIIVILTQSEYPPGAVERIAAVSQSVYDYFNNN